MDIKELRTTFLMGSVALILLVAGGVALFLNSGYSDQYYAGEAKRQERNVARAYKEQFLPQCTSVVAIDATETRGCILLLRLTDESVFHVTRVASSEEGTLALFGLANPFGEVETLSLTRLKRPNQYRDEAGLYAGRHNPDAYMTLLIEWEAQRPPAQVATESEEAP